MRCARCQSDNPSRNAFCGKCGASLAHLCPHCEAENPPDNAFWGRCGGALTDEEPDETTASAAPTLANQFQALSDAQPSVAHDATLTHHTGENRFVTVLFADMTSSVRTTHGLRADESAELVNTLLSAMVESLKRYDGRIDRFLGDGVLAVFGAPHSHENDPERAIRAAVEIRDAAEELGLGVTAGINSGEVFFGEMGSAQHSELTVMGPVVNLAARLQGKAEAGHILVGEATHRHTRRMFRFEDLSVEIKGIDGAVTAHRVEEALPRPERVRGIEGLRAELIGRDREFSDLKETLAKAIRGDGQIVTVIGEAGVGKSRLTSELQQFALTPTEDRPAPLWLEGRCAELGVTASYWPFIDALHAYFAWHTADDDSVRATAIVDVLQGMVSDGSLTEEQMEEMGPLLGHLLAVEFGNEWDNRLKFADGQQIRHQTFNATRDFLVALSRHQPLVLVLDDLHWADSLSVDLISLLMESLADAPIFLLCVYRPEQEHRCWRIGSVAERKCPERYHTVALRELTPDESRSLVEALLTIEDLPEPLKEMILEKAHGNPFFVEEVVRSLIDSGVVYNDGNVWTAAAGIESVTVPETVQSIALSRVDRLEAELRHVLQSASVIGRVFRRRVLERVATQSSDIEQALWELEDHALIYQGRTVPEPEYVFRHALTQDAVYQTVVQRRRAEFHGTVAREMEGLYADEIDEYVEQLAYHYELSDEDEKAVGYLIRAEERASKNYLNDEAIGYFERALERLAGSPAAPQYRELRLAALSGLGKIHHGLGNLDEAEERYREAIALGREMDLPPRGLANLLHWRGDLLYWKCAWDKKIQIGEQGLALLGDDDECVEAACMNEIIAVAAYRVGDNATFREFTHRTARFLRRLPYSEELRGPYSHVAYNLYLLAEGDLASAPDWLAAMEDHALRHHDLRALGEAYARRAWIADATGDLREALPWHRQATDVFIRIGDDKHRSTTLESMGNTLVRQGDLEEAEACLADAWGLVRTLGSSWDTAYVHMRMGAVSLCRHDWDAAEEAFVIADKGYDEADSAELGSMAALALSRVSLARGDRAQARRHCERSLVEGAITGEKLSALEEACIDDPDAYGEFRDRLRQERPSAVSLAQWRLEPADTRGPDARAFADPFDGALAPDWRWVDPFGGCTHRVEDGLAIHAANGLDLQLPNVGAPRLVRPVCGDFAIQTTCRLARDDRPAMGGLLIWVDERNYLRLDRGTRGPHEVNFEGHVGGAGAGQALVGRGLVRADRVTLRIETIGPRVRALVWADGDRWSTVGEAQFAVGESVEVGVHAIGSIARIVYPGAFAEGTAIHFDEFRIWQ
ncbi:hypothetical protein CMK11_06485 [Candidatus Poribacteria bacterium]|nr:hypothetical protein [Candidatus Poribacteria bacterium]